MSELAESYSHCSPLTFLCINFKPLMSVCTPMGNVLMQSACLIHDVVMMSATLCWVCIVTSYSSTAAQSISITHHSTSVTPLSLHKREGK